MDPSGYIHKTLRHFKHRFIQLHLSRELNKAVPYGYGYVVEVFIDAVVFDSIDSKGKKFCRTTIPLSEVKGITWEGDTYRRLRALANFVNFVADKPEISEVDNHAIDETRPIMDAEAQQQGRDGFNQ